MLQSLYSLCCNYFTPFTLCAATTLLHLLPVQSKLRVVLNTYMDPGGWGIVLLLVSLLLTRGVHVVSTASTVLTLSMKDFLH
jgi:hypothetical protein